MGAAHSAFPRRRGYPPRDRGPCVRICMPSATLLAAPVQAAAQPAKQRVAALLAARATSSAPGPGTRRARTRACMHMRARSLQPTYVCTAYLYAHNVYAHLCAHKKTGQACMLVASVAKPTHAAGTSAAPQCTPAPAFNRGACASAGGDGLWTLAPAPSRRRQLLQTVYPLVTTIIGGTRAAATCLKQAVPFRAHLQLLVGLRAGGLHLSWHTHWHARVDGSARVLAAAAGVLQPLNLQFWCARVQTAPQLPQMGWPTRHHRRTPRAALSPCHPGT